ncbi:MAG: pre-peptidase C-terminal domain-containing protein [Phycisphaerales bacterium]|nr:pre-peptidase C-terminal domain-containing protein [Phycisphaerales bacterium]
MKLRKGITLLCGLTLCTGTALAQIGGVWNEVEPNDNVPSANANNYVGQFMIPGGSLLIDGYLSPGDVDWYAFDIAGPAHLVAAAYALPMSSNLTDGQLMVIDAAGTIYAADDDNNIGFMPSIQVDLPGPGRYYIGISGYNDGNLPGNPTVFDGLTPSGAPHTEDWAYKLIMGANVIPEPASLVLLALGALFVTRRR